MTADTRNLPPVELFDLVESVLARNASLTGRNLRIEVHADAVVLRGSVRSYYHKQLAQESLRSVAGLSRITNELQVAAPARQA